jgi:hypothetical protein
MQHENLLAAISDRFRATSPPDRDYLISEDSKSIYEAVEISHNFQEYTWENISNQALIKHKAALSYFSDQAFVYFLPAYMRLFLQDIEAADTLRESLLAHLTLPSEFDAHRDYLQYKNDVWEIPGLEAYLLDQILNIDERIHDFIQMTALLTPDQSRCILNFLRHLHENHIGYFKEQVLEKCIQCYWFQFDE